MLRKPFTQCHSSAPGILALRYALVGRRFILGGSDGVSPRDAAQTNLVTPLALYEECVLGVRRGLLNEASTPRFTQSARLRGRRYCSSPGSDALIAKFLFATTATRSPTSLAFSNQQVWTGSGEPGVSLSK